jgi:hypothetical protein
VHDLFKNAALVCLGANDDGSSSHHSVRCAALSSLSLCSTHICSPWLASMMLVILLECLNGFSVCAAIACLLPAHGPHSHSTQQVKGIVSQQACLSRCFLSGYSCAAVLL